MKKSILFLLFYFNCAHAIEVTCNFEEVYKDGQVQEGILMIKDDMLRYQYSKDSLFTIISKQNNFYTVRNDSKIVQKLSENIEPLKKFIEMTLDYPDIKEFYEEDNILVKVEKSDDKFIKRLSIKSDELSLSVNIFNCNFDPINKKYFLHFNFVEYEQ